jgi:hypothetical protein
MLLIQVIGAPVADIADNGITGMVRIQTLVDEAP